MAAQLQQRPSSVVNDMDGGLTNGMAAVSPTLSQSVPVRSPSANGQRAGLRNGVHVNGQHPVSPHLQASPTLPNISQAQSPPRISLAPSMGLPSPSLQQQPVGILLFNTLSSYSESTGVAGAQPMPVIPSRVAPQTLVAKKPGKMRPGGNTARYGSEI